MQILTFADWADCCWLSVWISLILKLYSYWYSERLWDTRKRNLTLIRGKLKLKLVLTSKEDLKQPISEIINLLRDKVFQDFSSFKHFSYIKTQNGLEYFEFWVGHGDCTWLNVGVKHDLLLIFTVLKERYSEAYNQSRR